MFSTLINKGIPLLLFLGLLAAPVVLNRETINNGTTLNLDTTSVLDQYGFYLEEITSEAGIGFKHYAPILDSKIAHILPQIASTGASVSVTDINDDGWDDLYFTNSRTGMLNAMYRNNHDGTFTDVAPELGVADVNLPGTGVSMGSIWADVDNDGFEDLFLYKWGRCILFRNEEGKHFKDITANSEFPEWVNANTAVWLDVNNDGLIDLFIGGYFDESIDLWNLKNTRIMPESYEYANNGGRNYLFLNQGHLRFKDVTTEYRLGGNKWTLAVASADLNGDRFPELVLANDYGIDQIYLNRNGKYFQDISRKAGIGFTPQSGMSVSFGDIDNRGKLGIYISNITEPGVLIQGNNMWTPADSSNLLKFTNQARMMGIEYGGWSYGTRFGDLNNDGLVDLYVTNGYISAQKGTSYWYEYSKVSGGNKTIISDASNWPPMKGKSQSGYQQNFIWINKGGVFEDASLEVAPSMTLDSRSVVYADLFNHGALDVIVATQNRHPVVYKNHVVPERHWIQFICRGKESNRSSIGTIIEITLKERVQKQVITGGSGFAGQTMRRLHFGLGDKKTVDHVTVLWPSGKTQNFRNLKADFIYLLIEGEQARKFNFE